MQSHRLNLRYCCVKTCIHNRGTTSINIRFYKINQRPSWYRILKEHQATSNQMICHEHFTSDAFVNVDKKILCANAIPTIFDQKQKSVDLSGNQYAKFSKSDSYQNQIDALNDTIKELKDQAMAKQWQQNVENDRLMTENAQLKLKLIEKDKTIKALRSAVNREKQKNGKLSRIIEILTESKYLSSDDCGHLNVSIYYFIMLTHTHYIYVIVFLRF